MVRMPNSPMSVTMDNRVDELSRFIERPTTRLKETERLLARQLEVSDRELVLLRTLVADGPMITEELGGCFRVPVSTMTGLVDGMDQKGLVRRDPGRRDRRSIELEATPASGAARHEHPAPDYHGSRTVQGGSA